LARRENRTFGHAGNQGGITIQPADCGNSAPEPAQKTADCQTLAVEPAQADCPPRTVEPAQLIAAS
jgi:hypothetical protein